MAFNFQSIFDTLKNGIVTLAQSSLKDYAKEATKDGQNLLDAVKADLQNWTAQLTSNQISQDEFTSNVLGEKDVIEMAALKQTGIAAAMADQFKSAVLNLIVSTVLKAIPI